MNIQEAANDVLGFIRYCEEKCPGMVEVMCKRSGRITKFRVTILWVSNKVHKKLLRPKAHEVRTDILRTRKMSDKAFFYFGNFPDAFKTVNYPKPLEPYPDYNTERALDILKIWRE